MAETQIIIKAEREKPIVNQHPWIFSGAIEEVKGNPAPGEIVTVVNAKGKFLARGYWNAKSQIQVRLLTWDDARISDDWWERSLHRAFAARLTDPRIASGELTAFRAINAENDFLPGLIVDVYGEWAVLQALTLGIDIRKAHIAQLIPQLYAQLAPTLPKLRGVFERSDVDARNKEGLQPASAALVGAEPPDRIHIREGAMRYAVDVYEGHKTGFYLDQRDNRLALADFLAREIPPQEGQRMLNLFSYTGGFGIAGLWGSSAAPGTAVNVDSSHDALSMAEENYKLTFDGHAEFDYNQHIELIQADVFDFLRDQVHERERYDLIVCDPPKFAQNAQQVDRAARGYKDLNLNCFKLMKSGGYFLTFSCSGAVTADLFQKIVFGALADSGRQAQIVRHLGAADDHPVALTFPEGAYLKGLLLRVF